MSASAFHSARRASRDEGPRHAGNPAAPGASAVRRRTSLGRPAGLRAFPGARGAGVAIESALSLTVLVTVFAGLVAVAAAAYEDDRMGRAARAAARAVALVTDASESAASLAGKACDAIRQELDLEDDFDCGSAWTLSISTDLTPSTLAGGTRSGGTGDMVLVEIEWQHAPWVKAVRVLGGSDARIATGVARREPAVPAASA